MINLNKPIVNILQEKKMSILKYFKYVLPIKPHRIEHRLNKKIFYKIKQIIIRNENYKCTYTITQKLNNSIEKKIYLIILFHSFLFFYCQS